MPMKTSTKALNSLFLNLPISLTLCVVAQLLAIAQGQTPSFSMAMLGINFAVSYPLAFVIGMTIPCVKWGLAFAKKCNATPGTFKFGALVNIPINTTYAVILCLIMTFFNVVILGKGPLIGVVFGFLTMIIPVWIACYIVSMIFVQPAEKLARKITKDYPEKPQVQSK